MKNTLNHACASALLCGALLTGLPVLAAGTGVNTSGSVTTPAGTLNSNAAANANAAAGTSGPATVSTAGRSTSTGGLSSSGGDINNTTAGNNAGSVDMSSQTPSHRMARKAQTNANAAEMETTRQLNQQQAQSGVQTQGGAAGGATAQ